MKSKLGLFIVMILRALSGFVILGLLLFLSAGNLIYVAAWRFIFVLAALMFTMGIVLLIKFPETLEKRMKTKEIESAQKGYIVLSAFVFLLTFVLAGLDFRLGWSQIPRGAELAALGIGILGYALFAAAMFQNAYASRVVEVQEGQTVISSGVYSLIRHPMYLACLLLFLSMPIALGSFFALIPMLGLPVVLVLRIKNEEVVLLSGLEGYAEYMEKTKYRLIPYIW